MKPLVHRHAEGVQLVHKNRVAVQLTRTALNGQRTRRARQTENICWSEYSKFRDRAVLYWYVKHLPAFSVATSDDDDALDDWSAQSDPTFWFFWVYISVWAVVGFQLNCFCLGTESSRLIERGRFKRSRPHASLMIADLGRHKQPMKSSLLLGPTNKTHLSASFNQLPTFCLPDRRYSLQRSIHSSRAHLLPNEEIERSGWCPTSVNSIAAKRQLISSLHHRHE